MPNEAAALTLPPEADAPVAEAPPPAVDAATPAEGRAKDAGYVTPSMAQYVEIKAANPDCLLFYRMGDFYELFFEDAEQASQALGIVLTKRGKHMGEDIPMCGVPVSRAEEYLHKLIALGFRVAVCEQLEDPAEARKRGSKAVVRRDVTRLVTPGTITEDSLLDARRENVLLAVARCAPGRTGTLMASPGRTCPPAVSASPPRRRKRLPQTSPASSRPRCCCPIRSMTSRS